MSKKVLVVDDEKLIVKGIRFSLEQEGMEVDCAYDGEEALNKAKENQYDMILLDIMLPKMTGLEVCQQIREFSSVPIIMLTAKGSEYDTVLGLDSGADDYIAKPFRMMELISRVRAMLRRNEPEEQEKIKEYQFGKIYVCPSRHIVSVDGKEISLTLKEFELLCVLLSEQETVFSRSKLLDRIWGYEFDGESRTVDVHVRTLRQKLGDAGDCIKTVRGVGYKIGGKAS